MACVENKGNKNKTYAEVSKLKTVRRDTETPRPRPLLPEPLKGHQQIPSHMLGLLQGLVPVADARNTSPGRHQGSILTRCSNHPNSQSAAQFDLGVKTLGSPYFGIMDS